MTKPPSIPFNERLKALRRRSGLSALEVARRLGKPSITYKTWEDRARPRALEIEKVRAIARVLVGLGHPPITDSDVSALAGSDDSVMSVPNSRLAADAPSLPVLEEMPRDVPVFGTRPGAQRGGAFGVDMLAPPIDYVRRAPGIHAARAVFAIYVADNRMAPRFEVGELLYCDPARPVAPGAYVLVTLRSSDDPRPSAGWLGRKVRRTENDLVLQHLNPAREITIPLADIADIARVLDTRDLIGA